MGYLYYTCLLIFTTLIIDTRARVHNLKNKIELHGLTSLPNGTEKIETLYVIDSNLIELPENIFLFRKFYNLKRITLRNDHISDIRPNAFAKLSKVLQLDLYGNQLIKLQRNSFKGLESLRNLNLGSNNITSIDEEVLEPLHLLETLDLSFNQITAISRNLLKGKPVKHLYLEGNSLIFDEYGPILISDTLTHLNLQLTKLDKLSSNAFSMLPRLESLDLSKNVLKALPDNLLRHQVYLQHLDISFNLLNFIQPEIFLVPTEIEELYCDGNPLTNDNNCSLLLEEVRRYKDIPINKNKETILIPDSNSFQTNKDEIEEDGKKEILHTNNMQDNINIKNSNINRTLSQDSKNEYQHKKSSLQPKLTDYAEKSKPMHETQNNRQIVNEGNSPINKNHKDFEVSILKQNDEVHFVGSNSKAYKGLSVLIYSVIAATVLCIVFTFILVFMLCYYLSKQSNTDTSSYLSLEV